ncbi:transcriptional regulator [Duganella callida]|uniref:Helix-turn-helix domain-containing protein n=1 Tax=Duganella callida TaxID=2561932 RepID=A0A4Y9S3G6_9BURK|nr:YdaS family helix-turn-helix protein [Duganella callida]TFW15932.1 helix-turn-helix domain-containing protein [Duganella callida]
MNSLDKAIQWCDGLSSLAEKIGISSARLGNWRVRGVPVEHCLAIEKATDGQVTRKDLRPDDWQNIWPELADDHTRRATDPAPPAGHAGRQPSSPHNITDTVPERAVVTPLLGEKA